MRWVHSIVGVSLVLSAGAAESRTRVTGEARLAQLLDGRVAGPPVNCIQSRGIDSSEVIDKTAIVYRQGSTLYVNRPRGGADQLNNDDILVTRNYTGSLCSIDPVNLVDRVAHFQRGFVSLGEFVPYRKVKTAAR